MKGLACTLVALAACVADSADVPGPDARPPIDAGFDADIDAGGDGASVKVLAAGGASTCAVAGDGTLRCWGEIVAAAVPTLVDARVDWDTLDVGGHGLLCAIRGGTLACRGPEGSGFPAALATIGRAHDWTSVALGETHACGRRGGALFCWGDNTSGQVGGDGESVAEPRALEGEGWTAVAAGARHTCGLRAGQLLCWGDNTSAQLGTGAAGGARVAPTVIGALADWTAVAAGGEQSCAIRAGELYCWGETAGERRLEPTRVGRDSDWDAVEAGAAFACARKQSGQLYCFGEGNFGQHGDGDQDGSELPEAVSLPAMAGFAVGAEHACARGDDGQASCWGRNGQGELGDGHLPRQLAATRVGSATNWTRVAHFGGHTCGLRGHQLWCWGENDAGQLGLGDLTWKSTPTRVGTAEWSDVAVGTDHSCGVRDNGTLWCWGSHAQGQLGLGEAEALVPTPTQVGRDSNWIDVAAGHQASCARRADGSLWCWGDNAAGQLGVGDEVVVKAPTRAGDGDDWDEVGVGQGTVCGRRSGAAWCSGGAYGRAFVQVGEATDWVAVRARATDVCARKASGETACWSPGLEPTSIDGVDWVYADPLAGIRAGGTVWFGLWPAVPTLSAGSADFVDVSASGLARCGRKQDGSLWCWGEGSAGATGHGDAWRLSPVRVVAGG